MRRRGLLGLFGGVAAATVVGSKLSGRDGGTGIGEAVTTKAPPVLEPATRVVSPEVVTRTVYGAYSPWVYSTAVVRSPTGVWSYNGANTGYAANSNLVMLNHSATGTFTTNLFFEEL